MLTTLYRRRLERDLEVWRDRGWVTGESAEAILLNLESQGGGPRLANIVGFLGAVLIAFAAIAFVAANWAEMPRLTRLALLAGGMAVCYGAAVILAIRGFRWFADAAIFAGSALFGASIILVAQSYHISGEYPGAFLLWGAGAFIAALLGPSRSSLLLALVAWCIWGFYEVVDYQWLVHWPSLIAILAVATVAGVWAWSPGVHLSVLALAAWIGTTIIVVGIRHDPHPLLASIFATSCAVLIFSLGRAAAISTSPRHASIYGPALTLYGLLGFLGLQIPLQASIVADGGSSDSIALPLILVPVALLALSLRLSFIRNAERGAVWLHAVPVVLTLSVTIVATLAFLVGYRREDLLLQVVFAIVALVAAIWAIAFGNRTESRLITVLGLITFGAEVLYLYFVTFGTLLDTAVFFLFGGILMIALAGILVRVGNRFARTGRETPP